MNSQDPNLTLSIADRISAVDLSIDDDFTFAISSPAIADDISPTFPLFNLELLSDQNPDHIELRSGSTSSSSSSSSLEVDEDSYCAWNADGGRNKSASTGSGFGVKPESKSRWMKILGRRRSVSDGNDKFEYVNVVSGLKSDSGKIGKKIDRKQMDLVTAHKLFYGKGTKDGKKTYLPYRQELVGLW